MISTSCENIDGITINEFCKTTNTGMSFARKLINKLEKDGTIRILKINNKRILPKDIFAKLGFSQNYYPESKVEPSKMTDINTTRLFEDNTLSTNNHSKPLSTNISISNKSNSTLNIIKELQKISDMLKNGEINKSEFNFLKKSLMLEA